MALPNRCNNPKYVYDLPYSERMELCRILDQNDKWEELGGTFMHFDVLTIQTLRRVTLRGDSPSDELLTKWGHQNHTILELFVLLSKMQHYQAMLTIKQFVDPEYHRLIYEGEQNLSRLFRSRNVNNSSSNNRIEMNQPTSLNAQENSQDQNVSTLSHRVKEIISANSKKSLNAPGGSLRNYQEKENKSNERKILNNEPSLQPEEVNQTKNSNAQTVLVNRKENAPATSIPDNDLLRPRVPKDETMKDKSNSEISSIAESVGLLPVITFRELELATNGWDQSAILGKGGFGTVYRGTWKNTQVAIKRTRNSDTDENKTVQIQQILGELKMLNSYRHDNILPLYGFSLDAEEPCLIYQYMPNGSLEDRLLCRHGSKPLLWSQRHNIATGTARGLQFLHTIGEKPLIHGDIKSANILLDSNFEPKIGDFGLAREGPYSHYTHMKVSKVHGTRPYLPDEFLRHKKFSTKVDTHSFGVVLIELATGLRAYDDQRPHKFLKDLVENTDDSDLIHLMDKKGGLDEHQTYIHLVRLGKLCCSRKPKDRPEMVLVLQELNAMAVKRDVIVKVQNMIKQNSFSQLNPYEKQILQEHLSQQKRISPVSSVSTLPRAISPMHPMHLPPEISRVASPVANDSHKVINNNNPFHPLEPGSPRVIRKETRSVSPVAATNKNNFEVDKISNGLLPELSPSPIPNQSVNPGETKQPLPAISVSPPTGTLSSSIICEPSNLQPESIQQEDFDYEYSSHFVLPLISELGIKAKPDKKEENTESSSEPTEEIVTSAKGKELWILNNSNH